MSKRKNVFRINDRVKIINPLLFIRCGYPLTKEMIRETMTDEQKNAVHEMCSKFGMKTKIPLIEDIWNADLSSLDDRAYRQVLDVMSGVLLRKQGWGGSERKIYTEHDPQFINATGYVYGKRVVKTGHHVSGYGYTSYWGETDYEPPYLSQEETHVILEIYTDYTGSWPARKIEIEKCHVEYITKEIEQLI